LFLQSAQIKFDVSSAQISESFCQAHAEIFMQYFSAHMQNLIEVKTEIKRMKEDKKCFELRVDCTE
jgi:hypothetical protein